ncbi:MAG: AAA family ATPase [Oscillospiraceae bacterium]|nr:AAA family ATPase [Oscillospiraceae bacterium]
MRIISFINLKGGVAKTVSAINFAYILSQKGYRVLLIDADKQGNTTKFFNLLDYDAPSMSDILTKRGIAIADVAQPTSYENLHVVPANMSLLTANRTVLLDTARAQQTRLKKALQPQWDDYDFCIIDHAPDIGYSGNIDKNILYTAFLAPLPDTEVMQPLSKEPCRMHIGFASEGDIKKLTTKITGLGIAAEAKDGYIITGLASAGDQCYIMQDCIALGVAYEMYTEDNKANEKVTLTTALLNLDQAYDQIHNEIVNIINIL